MSKEDAKTLHDIKKEIATQRDKMRRRSNAIEHSPEAIEKLTQLSEAERELLLSPQRMLTVQLRASTVESLQEFSWYTVGSGNTG